MNMKRILTWGSFIIVIGLIVWGMIAAANKAERESASAAPVDDVVATDWVREATSTESVATLIEYSDFQCPACASFFPVVERLISENGDKVRFVYRHFPLPQHANAVPAAIAAEAAGTQGKFWEMYTLLFEKQDEWALVANPKTLFTQYATEIGLNLEKFDTDYNSEEAKERVNAGVRSGLKAGVNSTPTFYLNGEKNKSKII